jgi:hypothetical protein
MMVLRVRWNTDGTDFADDTDAFCFDGQIFQQVYPLGQMRLETNSIVRQCLVFLEASSLAFFPDQLTGDHANEKQEKENVERRESRARHDGVHVLDARLEVDEFWRREEEHDLAKRVDARDQRIAQPYFFGHAETSEENLADDGQEQKTYC